MAGTMEQQKGQTNSEAVRNELRSRITSGYYNERKRLPSERMLAEEFGVSRTTIRTALAYLASEHLLIREQGNGTLINTQFPGAFMRSDATWEFTKIIASNGKTCTLKPVNFLYRLPTREECRILNIREDEQVVSIDRLFYADAGPVIYSTNLIPARIIRSTASIEKANLPLTEFAENCCSERPSYGITEISGTKPPWNVALQMQVSVDSSVLKLYEVFYSKTDAPLIIGCSYMNTSKIKLTMSRYLE
ncbi:MAG: GntR family transcriptional regulator [Flexilinea sp.]|nr:GntR family transcriptional regulator [Flexilinea sp.]